MRDRNHRVGGTGRGRGEGGTEKGVAVKGGLLLEEEIWMGWEKVELVCGKRSFQL